MYLFLVFVISYLFLAGCVLYAVNKYHTKLDSEEELIVSLFWPVYLLWLFVKFSVIGVSLAIELGVELFCEWVQHRKEKSVSEKDSSQ